MLEHKLNVQIFVLEAVEIFTVVLQVQPDELEASGEDINAALDALLEFVLALIQEGHDYFQQTHFSIHVLG